MPEHQGPRRYAVIKIIVNGKEITSVLHPYLISCQVIDTLGGSHDQCNIELDDRNAELQLPPDNVPIQVALGWAGSGPEMPNRGRSSAIGGGISEATEAFTKKFSTGTDPLFSPLPYDGPGMELVFDGKVSSIESGFGRRSGGRRVWIEATSGNVMGDAKEGKKQTWGEGTPDDSKPSLGASGSWSTPGASGSWDGGAGDSGHASGSGGDGDGNLVPLSQVFQDAFKGTGIVVKMPTEMANIKRPAWAMSQSPMDFAATLGKELGGSFKLANGVMTFVKKGSGKNADDKDMPIIEAKWGVNLIGWRIKPYAGRPQWGGSVARVFNVFGGVWEEAKGDIGGSTPFGAAKALLFRALPFASKLEGEQANDGSARDSQSRRGQGWVLLNGDPRAKAGGHCYILDARPGVDGKYHMKEVEHNYTRGVGFTTRANVEFPQPFRDGFTWDRGKPQDKPEEKPEGESWSPQGATGSWAGGATGSWGEDKQPKVFTDEEFNRMRQSYRDRGLPVPPSLTQSGNPRGLGYAPNPPVAAPQSWTPEELERMRAAAQPPPPP
jgi:hypothetical protein